MISRYFFLITVLGTLPICKAEVRDLAALSIQDQSISKLKNRLARSQGSRIEPDLLYRLGCLYVERTSLTFRISEGGSHSKNGSHYLKSIKEGIAVLSLFLERFPSHSLAPDARLKRSKAYRELGIKEKAREDSLYLLTHYPDASYIDSVLMALADFAQDENQHELALQYLSKIESLPNSEYYPIALHKGAWSLFNLKRNAGALSTLKKEIQFYRKVIITHPSKGGPESAFLENALNDAALFAFETINQKQPGGTVPQALATLNDLDDQGKVIGPLCLRLAKLLKAYEYDRELMELALLIEDRYPRLPEGRDLVLLVFQHHFERKNWQELSAILKRFKTTIKNDDRAEKILSSSLSELHRTLGQKKSQKEREALLRPIGSLTDTLAEVLGKDHPLVQKSRYALAESFFSLEQYPSAEAIYRSLADETRPDAVSQKNSLLLRALSARYKTLKAKDLIPETLKALTADRNLGAQSSTDLQALKDWQSEVMNLEGDALSKDEKTSLIDFKFEGLKALALWRDRDEVLDALFHFYLNTPTSESGQQALTLVIDSRALSSEWEKLNALIAKIPEKVLDECPIKKRIQSLHAQAVLQIALQAHDPETTLTRTEVCLRKVSNEDVSLQCRALRSRALMDLKRFNEAEADLALLVRSSKGEIRKSAFLLRAKALEEHGRWGEALNNLVEYQKESKDRDPEIARKIIQLAWIQSDSSKRVALLNSKEYCKGDLENTCRLYQGILELESPSAHLRPYPELYRGTLSGSRELQVIHGLLALRDPQRLPFQDRMVLIQRIVKSWASLSAETQLRISQVMIQRIGRTLETLRITAPGIAPIRPHRPESLEKRVRLMEDLNRTFEQTLTLDWSALRIKTLEEYELLNGALLESLKVVQAAPETLASLQQKIAEIRKALVSLKHEQWVLPPSSAASLALTEQIRLNFTQNQWEQWKEAVQTQKTEAILQLSNLSRETIILRGLYLILIGAGTEAYALIQKAPDSALKTEILSRITRTHP